MSEDTLICLAAKVPDGTDVKSFYALVDQFKVHSVAICSASTSGVMKFGTVARDGHEAAVRRIAAENDCELVPVPKGQSMFSVFGLE